MANLREVLLRGMAARTGQPVEIELEASHLTSTLPPELRVYERNFKFTPVTHDPFPKPEPKKTKAKS